MSSFVPPAAAAASSEAATEASWGDFRVKAFTRPEPSSQEFQYEACSIPAGMTISEFRHSREEQATAAWWKAAA